MPCEDDPVFVDRYHLRCCTYSKTDYFQMVALGFSNGEMKDLVRRCPVSCQAYQWFEKNAAGPNKITKATERFQDPRSKAYKK
mmetsp:Transcript_10087/g.20278  ORF Transcript_10087/g.20278 Transcript_10087/m.20278 type:complete len:83 (-) Transcript_10087:58-306(-)